MVGWAIGYLMSWAWAYLADNWLGIAAYLIGAAIVCALIRKFMALYRGLPLAIGVCLLVVGAWTLGYRSAPVKTLVQTEVQTVTVEKPVIDQAAMDRLRRNMAAKLAQKDAEINQANAALAQLRQNLAAAKDEIRRLLAELAKPPAVETYADNRNGQCSKCRAVFFVSSSLLDNRESIRCPNCHVIMSARTFVTHRNYMLNRRKN